MSTHYFSFGCCGMRLSQCFYIVLAILGVKSVLCARDAKNRSIPLVRIPSSARNTNTFQEFLVDEQAPSFTSRPEAEQSDCLLIISAGMLW